jgi:hypothetical protein
VLTIDISEFSVELEEGSLKNVGAPNKRGTVKLYHVEESGARAFGDSQVKLVFEDGEGNEVQVALEPGTASALAEDVEALREDSPVFE